MSGSNRSAGNPALDQGLGVFAAIILACFVVGVLSFSWGRDSERDSQRAAEYQDYRERREGAFCADLSGTLLAKCQIEQEQAAREAYQSERDLEAQRDMSLWALAVFIIGFITAGLTLWALWYVRGTLLATREALDDTGKATHAMVRQNELAEIAQQPWLVLDIVEIEYCHIVSEGGLSIGIKWKVENIGDLPAIGAAWYVEAFVDDAADRLEIERRRLTVMANALTIARGNLQIFNLARGQSEEWRAGANISKAQIEAFAARFPSDAYVFPTIVCAVVYKSPASGRWLVSDCSWMIRRTNEAGAVLGLKVSDLPYPPQTLRFADSVSFTPRIGEPIEVGATKSQRR